MVAQKGIPRKNLVVARYVAPSPPRAARPRIRLKRGGTKLVVTWGKDAVGKQYVVSAKLSDGRVLLLLPTRPAVTIAGVARATTATITVYVQDASRVKGPSATARLKGVKMKR